MKSRNLKFERIKKGRKRLCIYKSNAHIYANIIDDVSGNTLVSSSTLSLKISLNLTSSKEVGKDVAEKAKKHNISEVFFDRNGNKFHGNTKALADAARETGLRF